MGRKKKMMKNKSSMWFCGFSCRLYSPLRCFWCWLLQFTPIPYQVVIITPSKQIICIEVFKWSVENDTKRIFCNFSPFSLQLRIRIHVPVKHHTHVITKTIVKTVHIPIKKEKKYSDEESWSYSKKSKFL